MLLGDLGLLADVEFGRLQARDLLQHLWTGPISNAPVNIVQGSKSVEVRPVGISKVCPWTISIDTDLIHVCLARGWCLWSTTRGCKQLACVAAHPEY